jgi:UPF0271 protein
MSHIDINCDLGEGADDAALMALVTSANIACGGHAGDESTMRRAVQLALEAGANIGAHPSYEDRANFGRAELHLPAGQLRHSLVKQIESLKRIAESAGGSLRHVKPHGALYNVALRNPAVASAILDAVWEVDSRLAIVTMPHGCLFEQAAEMSVTPIAEGFADRSYQSDGTLTPRSEPHALLTREMDAADQVLWMVRDGAVRSVDGAWMAMSVQTICVHGDGRSAVPMLRLVRDALAAAGIAAKPF